MPQAPGGVLGGQLSRYAVLSDCLSKDPRDILECPGGQAYQ